MPWYPNKLAWHMNFSRAQLRKMPVLTALHEFIKRENDAGSISRQEAVSMVPPLFLDVQPHHAVRSSTPSVLHLQLCPLIIQLFYSNAQVRVSSASFNKHTSFRFLHPNAPSELNCIK